MPSMLRPLPCDAELLSAYRDGALDPSSQRLLEAHLRACPACRQELAEYRQLAELVNALPIDAPNGRLSADLAARLHAPPQPRFRRLLPVELVAACILMAFIVTGLVFHAMPAQTTAVFAAYPPLGANDVSTDTAIRVTFPAPVDRQHFLASIHFDPPVAFDVVWDSSKQAELIPVTPLDPNATYALVYDAPATTTPTDQPAPHKLTVFRTALKSPEEGGPTPAVSRATLMARAQSVVSSVPTPLRARLRAAIEGTSSDRSPTPFAATPTVGAKPAGEVESTTAPSARTTSLATATSNANAVPSRAADSPGSRGPVAAPTTRATSSPGTTPGTTATAQNTPTTTTSATATQAMTAGRSPVPSPTTASAPGVAAPAGTVTTTSGATTSAATATAAAIVRPTVASGAASTATCAIMPQRGFGLVYQSRPDVQAMLGCATGSETAVTIHSQIFQRGILLALPSQRLLYQFGADASWRAVAMGPGDQATGTGANAPSGGAGPTFLAYWRGHPALHAAFGLALGPEQAASGTMQAFANGQMLWTPGWVFVLADGGRWLRFVDTWSPDMPSNATPGGTGPTEDDATSPGSTFKTLGAAPSPTSVAPSAATVPASSAQQTGCVPSSLTGLWQRAERFGMPLGCPVGQLHAVGLVVQPFERGTLVWRADADQILALFPDGTSATYVDRWHAGTAIDDAGADAPQGFFAPVRGFGLLWRDTPALRERLGWALTPEQGVAGTLLTTSQGLVLQAGSTAYALAPSGAWTSFLITGMP